MEIILFLINLKGVRHRYWNEEVKTKRPEQLAPSHLLLEAKLEEQGEIKGLPVSVFLMEIFTSCKPPWMGRETKRMMGISGKGKS
jgi:hypothetical protein